LLCFLISSNSFHQTLSYSKIMHFIKKQKGKKIVDLHVHSFFSKGLKLFVWSESAEWDWVSFLENANPSGKVNRLVEIHCNHLGEETVVKDYNAV
jgi:hypothetical protein